MLRNKSIFNNRAELEAYASCMALIFVINSGISLRRDGETKEQQEERVQDLVQKFQDIVYSTAEEYAILIYRDGVDRIPSSIAGVGEVTDDNVAEARAEVIKGLEKSCNILGTTFEEIVKSKGDTINDNNKDSQEG